MIKILFTLVSVYLVIGFLAWTRALIMWHKLGKIYRSKPMDELADVFKTNITDKNPDMSLTHDRFVEGWKQLTVWKTTALIFCWPKAMYVKHLIKRGKFKF